jgi:hypothetical protein
MTTTFWRLMLDGKPEGLFRRREQDGTPVEFAFLGEDGWVNDPTLYRWWLDPGDIDLIEVDRETAEGITRTADVELDAPGTSE